MELQLGIWWVIAGLALLEAVYSLAGGFTFRNLLGRSNRRTGAYAPPATLILPCRGLDPGLEENLGAFLSMDYPNHRLLFVTDTPEDPCVAVVEKVLAAHPGVDAWLLFAGPAKNRGQKVHNLLYALSRASSSDQVLAFGDSDIRPSPLWLRHLVSPLENREAGMSTGFRWYLPVRFNFASRLRSVWNAGSVSLMKEKDNLFAWGGAMAIRRETFDACRVREYWESALSDDYSISRALRDQKKSIFFQPAALSFSHEDCTFRELLDWTLRQMIITRIYHPSLWRMAFAAQFVHNAAIWGGILVLGISLVLNPRVTFAGLVLAALLGTIYTLGCCKAWLRVQAVCRLFPEHRARLRRHRRSLVFWGPLAALVSLVALLRSAWSRELTWRGICYRLVSPSKTEVLRLKRRPSSRNP